MFDESLVVQSAVSAFNNAALVAPTFFWLGLFSIPLMALAYLYGRDFLGKIGWNPNDLEKNASIFTVGLTLLWLVLFGGNYMVLRDAASVLPFCIAGLIFVCAWTLGAHGRDIQMPKWRGASWRRKLAYILVIAMIVWALGVSAMHTWLGVLMQIVAFFGGGLVGRYIRRTPRAVPMALFVMFVVATLMLMQPEFFRFGELGALSVLHMGALLVFAMAALAALVLRNVKSRGRIHHSAYVKLKWMARFVVALGIVLFFMTESVPVFLGLSVAVAGMFALSVWHAGDVASDLASRMLAIALGMFGLITTLPVLSALGVLIWISAPAGRFDKDSRFLL
ncbi:hypothetical protein HDR61_00945 [bacterium]|nr:hypothetical protein [bacterium]